MKADFVKVDANRIEMTIESIRQKLGWPLQKAIETVDTALRKRLTHRDNFDCAVVELPFVHGVETFITNPLRSVPVWFEAKEAWDATTRAPLAVQGVKFNRRRRDDGLLPITVEYDLRHTEPLLRMRSTVNQSIPNGGAAPYTPVTFNSTEKTRGATGEVPTYSGGVFTLPVAGTYGILFQFWWQEIAGYTAQDCWFDFTGTGATSADGYVKNANSPGFPIQFVYAEPSVSAGATFSVRAFQTNGAGLGRNLIGGAANLASTITIARRYNDSTPTGIVRGVLWSG